MKYLMKNGRPVKVATLPVTNCDGCGACCRHIGTPPGYATAYAKGGIPQWFKKSPDYERWLKLPADVEADLRAYYDGVKAGTIADRTAVIEAKTERILSGGRVHTFGDIPCLWYDAEVQRCRHYEHRPETCRDAITPGDAACLATRQAFRIPLPIAGGGA